MVWEHLNVSKAHVAYACVGVFSITFSLVSYVVKEKLYTGESTAATIFGLIVGPHCLDWFNPSKWGNLDNITLELSRIVLCVQIFATAVELPKKYMMKHWVSVFMLLVPVMTAGWLICGAFIFLVMPGFSFPDGLLVSACITATDPILSQSIVSGAFAQTHVPKHLRNLISAESGCNDGMAFPFIYLSLHLIVDKGNAGEIVKQWFCVTLLYECALGTVIGIVIGYCGRHIIKYCEAKRYIDRESFLAFYIILAITCAGFGSILAVDDLLVSFAAGAAFAWDGWFAKKTHETHISTVIDLLLNYSYFIYFGSIIPWSQFNSHMYGLDVWRLVVLAIVIIFLRRLPAVMTLWRFIPDVKSVREALFVGWFGSIGVGAIFASILARSELEHYSIHAEHVPLEHLPAENSKYYRLIYTLWPLVTFFVVTSIIVHGSSVAMMMLGRHLNTITLTRTFTAHTTGGGMKGPSWMQRLPDLNTEGQTVSLQRIDTMAPSNTSNEKFFLSDDQLARVPTVETGGALGLPYMPETDISGKKERARPIGGAPRKQKKKKESKALEKLKNFRRKRQEFFGMETDIDKNYLKLDEERIKREKEAKAASFALSPIGGNKNQTSEAGVYSADNSKKSGDVEEHVIHSASQSTEQQQKNDQDGYDQASYGDYDYDEDEVYNTHNQYQYGENDQGVEYNYSDEEYDSQNPQFLHNNQEMNLVTGSVNHLDRIASHISGKEQHNNTGDPRNVKYKKETGSFNDLEKQQSVEKLNKQEALNKIYSLTHDTGNKAYTVGKDIIIENKDGEVIGHATLEDDSASSSSASSKLKETKTSDNELKSVKSNNSVISRVSKIASGGASGLKKILSGEDYSLPKQDPITKEHKKYYAYRIDNQLIIEDENGDVLRRYRINTQDNADKGSLEDGENRHRSDSLMNKALSKVGLGRKFSHSSEHVAPETEAAAAISVATSVKSPVASIPSHLKKETYPTSPINYSDIDENEDELDEEDAETDNEEYDDDDEDEDEDETDIERYRRLAAASQQDQGAKK